MAISQINVHRVVHAEVSDPHVISGNYDTYQTQEIRLTDDAGRLTTIVIFFEGTTHALATTEDQACSS